MKHGQSIIFIKYSPDGQTVMTGGGHHIRLWDAATGEAIGPTIRYASGIDFASLTPRGDGIITVEHEQGDIRIRNISWLVGHDSRNQRALRALAATRRRITDDGLLETLPVEEWRAAVQKLVGGKTR